jgi:hypothetical protein
MARQLDFNPLDFRQAIAADPAGRAIAGTISHVFGKTAEGIQKRQEKKEQIKKDFIEQMKYDTSITGNNIINNRVAYEYQKLRDKHLKVLAERKGWLTPEDQINLRSDMQALSSLTNELKSVQNLYDKAKQNSLTKDGRQTFNLNTDKWGELMAGLSGDEPINNLLQALNDVKQSDSGFPFLEYKPFNVSVLENVARKQYRQQFKGDTQTESYTVEKNGKTYTTAKKTTTYGDDISARGFMKNSFLDNPNAINYSKGLQEKLTDSQKRDALNKYGPESENPSKTPFLDYYVNDIFNPSKFTQEVEQTKEATRPTRKGGGLSLIFGGGTAKGPDEYKPQEDQVEGVKLNEYVEFAKAGRTPKTVRQVTVTGAQRVRNGNVEEAKNLDTPSDYTVAGYSLDDNKIILTKKEKGQFGDITRTYFVPLKGNEHFLKGLFDDKTMQEIEKRANINQDKEQKRTFVGVPEGGF